jgi:hypothetical protein
VVDEERVGGEGERHRGEPQGLDGARAELLARDVELPDHGHDRPPPQHVRALDHEERREQEETDRRGERADEVDARPPARVEACQEQDRGDRRDGPRPSRHQRRRRERRE